MTTLRENLLPVFDIAARQLMDDLGLRTNSLEIFTRTWSGPPGATGSTHVDSDPLTITPRPKIRSLSKKEIAASGGLYADGDVRVTKITPKYMVDAGGGYETSEILPSGLRLVDVVYRITGPNEGEYKVVDSDTSKNFGYELTLRRTRKTP